MLPHVWMSEDAAIDFLKNNLVGRLATCDADGQPYVIAVNYVYHEGKVYFHSKNSGHKLDNLAVNARVCFEVSRVDELVIQANPCKSSTRYSSVVVFGQAGLLEHPEEKAAVLNAIMASHAGGKDIHPVTVPMADSCAVIAITITKLTGKRNIHPA